ncbi:hypothetical protein PHLGIDRAFT_454225 [Phlebiopsis gigantea 11061_1 CR5-6]|uniref:DUF6533 domain-containing protein n=1 Tax=Phlebiopsis gigantea (strain 11061_1 CR5-6) TaxID=745531 RepID=A0A0C3SD53_PHLG1|nr:hypothetical protein PHLGIDRAFT_454225 [Phlebiopsis gigantea 11061_1 CR5-6]
MSSAAAKTELVQALHDANTTRYLSGAPSPAVSCPPRSSPRPAVGLIILFYDHLLTFSDEVRLVWAAPRSFPKYAFLFNKYLVLACLLSVAHEMCGFVGQVASDLVCKRLISTTSMLSLASTAIGNILVLLRVVMLWDHQPVILKLMVVGFFVSFATQTVMMSTSLVNYWPGIVWSSRAGMCITQFKNPLLIGVWASPMLFEVLVLVSTIVNALDRPQQAEMPLTRALHRDGIIYFFAVTCFRTLNLTLAVVARSSLTMAGVFWIWGMTTAILNRALLRMRATELASAAAAAHAPAPAPAGEVVIVDMDARERPARWLELDRLSSSGA